MQKMNWHVVKKDGNPTKDGQYYVILIYNEWEDGKKTDKRVAAMATRYFADLDLNPDLRDWVMEDQPDSGLVWTEETGSIAGESVYAWLELDEIDIPELPEGVTLWKGE